MVPSRAKVCSWSGSSNRLVGAAINPGRFRFVLRPCQQAGLGGAI